MQTRIFLYILEEKQRMKSCIFLRVMTFLYRAHGRMRCSYREIHCSTCIAVRIIFTDCDVYKSEEINEKISKNTCSNVVNNAI